MNEKVKNMTFGKAVVVFLFLFVSMLTTIKIFGGSPHIPLLSSAIVAGIIAVQSGYDWKTLEEGIKDSIRMSSQAIIIMLIIGAIIGTWILAGIVPTMIYYGLRTLSPSIFLVATCFICSIVSIATGSSWSTAGTVGVALMGVGIGLGVPPQITAGAIISGAYFGDKMSPLSDTTNLAPAMAGADLFDHIKHMIFTTGPSYVISMIIYAIIGYRFAGQSIDASTVNLYIETLNSNFSISLALFIPPLLVILMVAKKVPALPALTASAVLGCIFAAVFQEAGISQMIAAAHYGFSIDTGVEIINNLLNRGGVNSMMWTVSLVLISLSFAGIVEKSNMINIIVHQILRYAKKDKSVVTATLITTIFTALATGVQYVAIIIPGRMYKDVFDERGLKPVNLSRALEDMGTLLIPIIPWGAGAGFMAGTLGVRTLEYLPYAYLNLINPIIALVYSRLGFSMPRFKSSGKDEKEMV